MSLSVSSRIIAAAAATALGAVLASCSSDGSSPSTPAQVLANYVTSVNNGDYKRALSYVKDAPQEIADQIFKPAGTVLPDPVISEEDPLDDEDYTETLKARFGDEDLSARFVKVDGDWKLERTLFIASLEQTTEGTRGLPELIESGSTISDSTGESIFNYPFIVANPWQDIKLTLQFTGNEYVDARSFDLESSSDIKEQDTRYSIGGLAFRNDLTLSDRFFSRLEESARADHDYPEFSDIYKTVEFASKDQCEVPQLDEILIDDFQVHCVGGTVEMTYGEDGYDTAGARAYRHNKGETKEAGGEFDFTIKDGEITSSVYFDLNSPNT